MTPPAMHPIERCEVAGSNGRFVIENVYQRLEFFPRDSREKLVIDNPIMGGMGGFDDTFRNRIDTLRGAGADRRTARSVRRRWTGGAGSDRSGDPFVGERHGRGGQWMNIVLIALDTQRADHLGCYGYPKRYQSIHRQHRETRRALRALLRAEYPDASQLHDDADAARKRSRTTSSTSAVVCRSTDGVRLLPEILNDHGYATAAVDSMGRHFTRGFDEYVTYEWDRSEPTVLRKAETVNEQGAAGDRAADRAGQAVLPVRPLLGPAHTLPAARQDTRASSIPRTRDPYDVNNHSLDEAWSWDAFKWYFHEWMPGVTDAEYVNNLYDGETRYMDRSPAYRCSTRSSRSRKKRW